MTICIYTQYTFFLPTCAPLWSSYTLSSMFGALGTCFISNGTYVERYFGLTEKYYEKDGRTKIGMFI